jgi:hypothetical protein
MGGFILCSLIKSDKDASKPKDYIDWSKVPEEYNWVAVQPSGSVFQFPEEPNHTANEDDPDWWYNPKSACERYQFATHVIDDAIIGPLPPWRESLRHRPGVTV